MTASEPFASVPQRHVPSLRLTSYIVNFLREVFAEPCERLAPRGFRRGGVVARTGIVVESVVHVRVDDLAEGLAVLAHRRLDRRNVLVDAVVEPAVDREHRRADPGHIALLDGDAVKRHGGPQIGYARCDAPGYCAAEAEAGHSDAVPARGRQRARVR